jgi:hypothetical protein
MEAGFLGLFSAVIAMIADGIRRIGRGGQSWKTTLTLLAGILLPLVFISAGMYSHYEFHRMEELLRSNEHSIQRIAERLHRPDLSPEKHSVMSRIYAREIYSEHGRIIPYTTPDGKQVLYQPTDKDKKFREAIIETKKTIEDRKPAMLKIIYTWLLSILLGISCGLFARHKWKSKDDHITK